MKVHDKRSHSVDEDKMVKRKHKAEGKAPEPEQSPKKAKTENESNQDNGKSTEGIKEEFKNFCKATSEHLSIKQMREILESNGQDPGGSDDAVVPRCQDILFYGPLDNCPICDGSLEACGSTYSCRGSYSEWSSCPYSTKDPPRRENPIEFPDSVKDSAVADLLRRHRDLKTRPLRELPADKPFKGLMVSLSGRLTRTHQYWKSKIEKHGGKVVNSIAGATCVVVTPSERDRGGSSKLADAIESGIPVVREAWLSDSIEKKEAQPLDAYVVVGGKGIPLDKQDASEDAFETITAELKVYGKRGVHKDTKLQDQGGQILEENGILYNCVFAASDRARGVNECCILQLIVVPENRLYMYYKRGKIGDNSNMEERLDEWENVGDAIKEFSKLFRELTGNEFEPWETEKKIQKKKHKLFPIDIDDGVEVRHGGLGLRQLGVAAAHSKLEPKVAHIMKILCGQEIYRYALMEIGIDVPDIPFGMLTDLHLKGCEGALLEFVEKLKQQKETGMKGEAMWSDFSQRMFTLMPSTRPFIFRDSNDLADHVVSAFETVRDINAASRIIGDMSGSTLDDPLFEVYKKLRCSISPVEKEAHDYKMIAKYLERTYEPVKVGEISYGISIENVFSVELSACPSLEEMKKLPNKVLLWCGTRSSNMLRHLQKGLLLAPCSLPVPGYMFGKAIICSDAASEAARYGFTAVDRPEGFLILAIASMGENLTELISTPEDSASLEEKKHGVIGRGRKKTDESEHFIWNDDIKVPCGRLIPSEHKNSPLEYDEYAIYDPQQVTVRFLVAVKFEEKDVVYDVEE
ncbi:protein ADP-ribosyltransferase PARP3 isoform X2 [Primulina tabacum]|uniref:protein ADP-ribosyltransferase PARP3 isoform X2 n=1 Tax=Primulina tabacum TaxID=48773 RepID=UPI003F5A38E8